MDRRAREFRAMVNQLMREGWRAYLLKDVDLLEAKGSYLHHTNREILYYENTPIFFVRTKYRKDSND